MNCWHEHRSGNEFITRHIHTEASVALVLSGGYEEAGDRGRFHVRAGDVVIHAPYDMHLDRFTSSGAHILNLPYTHHPGFSGFGRIENPDLIARVAEGDVAQAMELEVSAFKEHSSRTLDWPEHLAQVLSQNPELCVWVIVQMNSAWPQLPLRAASRRYSESLHRSSGLIAGQNSPGR